MHIVPFYAALLALLFVALSVRTLYLRRTLHIAVGDGGNATMLRAMRVHSNFAEYVPFSLILFFLIEQSGAHSSVVHLYCASLLCGRVIHAFGVSQVKERFAFRVAGMALTLGPLLTAALRLLGQSSVWGWA